MRIAFFGDTNYVGTRDWLGFLASQRDCAIHAIHFPGERCGIEGVRFHSLGGPIPSGKLRYLACVPALRAALRKIAPDLLIAYRVVSYGFAASLTGFHPLVLAAQGQYAISPETPGFFRLFAKHAILRADLIHAWAPPMAENLGKLGADPSRILTLTRGVDSEVFHPSSPPPPPPLTLVSTRQLEPYYDHATLLDAVARVLPRVGRLSYIVAGEGSERTILESAARDRGIDSSVRFLGRVARDRLPELLRSAHLYVSAVPTDGTSMSLLEALASGVVPIVADNESNRFWVREGVTGRLVAARDAAAYADAIEQAWVSESWRLRAREAGRAEVVERASWQRNMSVFAQAYRRLAGEGKAPTRPAGAAGPA